MELIHEFGSSEIEVTYSEAVIHGDLNCGANPLANWVWPKSIGTTVTYLALPPIYSADLNTKKITNDSSDIVFVTAEKWPFELRVRLKYMADRKAWCVRTAAIGTDDAWAPIDYLWARALANVWAGKPSYDRGDRALLLLGALSEYYNLQDSLQITNIAQILYLQSYFLTYWDIKGRYAHFRDLKDSAAHEIRRLLTRICGIDVTSIPTRQELEDTIYIQSFRPVPALNEVWVGPLW